MTISISQALFDNVDDDFCAYLEDIIKKAAESFQPAENLNVAQAAEKYRYLNNGASYTGPWRNDKVPYLVQPMEEMTNRAFESIIFVGPAQCGKTELFLNYLLHTVMCDPADIMLVQTVQGTARDFSMARVDRMHRDSEAVGDKVLINNVYDKTYSNGVLLRLSWPSINELSGKPIPRVFETDYDRMDQDVDGEGTPFALGKARTTSFRNFGKTIAESSPGFPVLDGQWAKTTPHEAPPCQGILSLYNAGDRRRWYWKCVSKECGSAFEPHWSLISYPKTSDPVEAGEMATMHCPHCGHIYTHAQTKHSPSKEEMNIGGRWLKEGNIWLPNNQIVGEAVRSNSATFWLQGVAATFNSWKQLVTDFLNAENEYAQTGKEDTLKTVVNTKIGNPYLPKAQANARIADQIKKRAKPLGMKVVPHGVRFLIATIDIQKNRFEVQINGVSPDDIYIVDRFAIRYSKRPDPEDVSQFLPISPGSHAEDWRHILYEVMMKSYPLADDPDRHMAVYYTLSDSAGEEGFTANAYDFYRWLGKGYTDREFDAKATDASMQQLYPWHAGFQARFQLMKGSSLPSVPTIRLTYPDAERKDRLAQARGEIPILQLNTTNLKNSLDGILERTDPGGLRVIFPDWLPLSYYKELVVETKNKEGKWENLTGHRNESWDLLVYCLAGLLHVPIGWEHIRWQEPPDFAAEWDKNSMVYRINGEDPTPFEGASEWDMDLEDLGASLNG